MILTIRHKQFNDNYKSMHYYVDNDYYFETSYFTLSEKAQKDIKSYRHKNLLNKDLYELEFKSNVYKTIVEDAKNQYPSMIHKLTEVVTNYEVFKNDFTSNISFVIISFKARNEHKTVITNCSSRLRTLDSFNIFGDTKYIDFDGTLANRL